MKLKGHYTTLDSDHAIFFEKELEHQKSRTFDIKFPELKARTLLPVDTSAGPGAESIKYDQFDQVGMAKLISSYADDLPRADVRAREFISPVKSLGASYGWSIQEVRAAAEAGKSLVDRKTRAARRSMMSKENFLAWFGDADAGCVGFINNPNIISVTLPNDGTGPSILWSTKTPDQILRDLNLMATSIHETSKGVESPDTLLLDLSHFNLIFTTRITDTDISIGKWFLDNSPHIKNIDWLDELKTAGSGGTSRMMAYKRSPDNLTLEIPVDFEQFPAQERGLELIVPVHQRFGGVLIYYPLSVAGGDGI